MIEEFNPKDYLKPGLTEKDIIQIKEVFDTFDTQNKGVISPMDLRNAMMKFGYNAKRDTIFHIISQFDENGNGNLNFEDFVKLCSNNNKSKETKNNIKKIFLKYDKNRKNYIDINDLKRISKELNEETSEEVLIEMMKSIDSNLDGKVEFEEFYNILTKNVY